MKCFECGQDASVLVEKRITEEMTNSFNPFKLPKEFLVQMGFCKNCFDKKVKA